MCQATKTLGAGSQNQPNGSRDVSNPVGGCPLKDLASVMVEVYEGNSATILKDTDAKVTLNGPSSGQTLAFATATQYVAKLTPGADYKVNVTAVSGSRYDGGTVSGDLSGGKAFALGKGETRRVVFRLFPPATMLEVKVVDKDTGATIPNTRFNFVARNTDGKEYAEVTDAGGTKTIVVAPGSYNHVSVEFVDADQKARFQLAELGKATVAAGKTESATVKVAVRKLRLVSVNPNFAPSVEDLEIRYDIWNIGGADEVWLRILDHTGASVLYERRLSGAEQANGDNRCILWGRSEKVNCPGHELHGKFINPLFGPYKVVLFHSASLKDEKEFNVILHAVELEWMKWADVYKEVTGGDAYPDSYDQIKALNDAAKKLLWAKCRLNEIGYSAGPINPDPADADFKKAIRRYGTMRGINGKALTVMMTAAELEALANLGPSGFPLDDLIEHLAREKNLVVEPIANRDQLCQPDDPARPLKLFIDATRFFRNVDWNPDKTLEDSVGELSELFKHKVEGDWFSRPTHALRARLLVKKKDNRTGEHVPELVKDLRVSWSWKDAPEDLDALPDPNRIGPNEANDFNYAANPSIAGVYAKPECRSKSRTYIERVRQQVRTTLGDCGYNENARDVFGGVITNSRTDNATIVFSAFQTQGGPGPDFERSAAVASGNGGVVAGPIVYFRPSLIAGDRYRITAQIEVQAQRQAGAPLSATRQRALEQLNDFAALKVTTGTIQAWRQVRVSAFINWPRQEKVWDSTPSADKPFDFGAMWRGVQKEFSYAYLELVPCRPGTPDFPRYTPSQITLRDDDYRDKPQGLLRNGVKVRVSLSDCVKGSVTKVGGLREGARGYGRELYTDPGSGRTDPVEPTDESILPRVQTKKMQVDATQSLELNPPNGDVPSISRILQYFLPNLKTLLTEAKKGWPGASGNYNQALFADVWFLALAWKSYDPTRGPLQREIQKAGGYLSGVLARFVRLSPRFSGSGVLKRSGALGPDKPIFEWIASASDNPPAVAYTEASAFDYGQDNFPELMRLILLPEPAGYQTVQRELSAWAADEAKVSAPRTASVYNLLAGLAKSPPNQTNFIDFVLYYVWEHYKNALGDVLESGDVAVGTKTFRLAETGKFRANVNDAVQRQVPPFLKTIAEIDESFIGPIVGNGMKALGGDWAEPLDQIVRKGIGCRRDAAGYYTDFAEGMIIINARINKPYQVGPRSFSIAGTSEGMELGVVFVSHYTPMEPYALFAHEIGHVLFMEHYQNSGGDLAFDHDRFDGNCIMSYPNLEVPNPASFAQLTQADRTALHGLKLKRLGEWPTVIATIRGTSTRLTLSDGTGPRAKLNNPANASLNDASQFNVYSATLTGTLPKGARFTGPGTKQVHTVTEDCTAAGNKIDGVKCDPVIKPTDSFHWPHDAEVAFRADYGGQLRKRISIANFGENMLAKVYRPHYCGKCNLKLRGWDIYAPNNTADLLPQFSVTDVPDNPPFASLQTLLPQPATPPPALARPTVRFIPGTLDDSAPAGDGQALTTIGVSFYPSNLTGSQTAAKSQFKAKTPELKAFPIDFGYNADAAADPGAFRVEIVDPNLAVDRVYVTLEARKPVYSGGRFTNSWEDFTGDERKKRALVHVECRPIGDDGEKAHCYRSRYLRLVTDDEDFAALAPTKQGLLVSDLADGAETDNDLVEILDQQVRVTYDPTPP